MYLKWISLISDDKFMALIPRNFDEIKQELITEKKNIQDQNDTLNSQIELLRSENNHLKAEIILIRESLSFRIENKLSGFYHRVFYNNPLLILKRRVSNSRNLKTIKESGLFDEAFYLNNNPDVKESGSDALTHYLKFGGFEGRDPSESFDSAFYYVQNPDVKAANLNPLLHYLMFGKNENRIIKKEIIQPPLSIKDRFLIQKQAELSAFIQSEKYIDLTHPQPQVSVILVLFNKAELTLACLTSLRDYSDVQMEIIIVDNNSTDLTIDLLKKVKVTRVIYHPENRRYLEACNQAMEFVSTPYILFLNNDTEISRGSISTALKMMIENDEYGAVGAKLILPDGTLQEAGNIIWRDGSCDGYGRGDSPDLLEYNFRRIVDYCSGAFLLTRTELIKKYGGFDPLFAPAYYEETDYCLWIQAQGFHVIYDPNVVVRHFEFGSSDLTKSVEILKINLEKFAIKHKNFLAKQFESGISNLLNARFAASQRFRHKILYVDDMIPHPAMGMGFRRSHAIVHSLEKLGFLVTLYPNIFFNEESLKSCYQDISPSIEIILNYGHQRFPDFINERKDYYDFVWISKPHNMQCNYEHLVKYRNRFKIIYNPADILTEKIMAKAKINADQSNTENYGAMPDTEIDLCKKADIVVAISEIDAASLRGFAINNVYVLGHTLNTQPGVLPFEKRKNLLFVGNLDNEDTPNVDASRWFVNEVLPLVKIITYPDPAF
jgi:GT2 family glycosyltransferase